MHADGPRAVGPHGNPVEASASTTASDVGDIWKSDSKNLNKSKKQYPGSSTAGVTAMVHFYTKPLGVNTAPRSRRDLGQE